MKLLFIIVLGLICKTILASPVKLIVPFAPGSTIDTVARTLADPLSQKLKVPVIVENKVGAGGNIANKFVANSDNKSITLLINSAGLAVNSAFAPNDYKLKNLVPLIKLGSSPVVLTTSKKSKIQNFENFLDQNNLTYGSSGINSLTHLYGELLGAESKKTFTHVPYKGVNQSLLDLLDGRIDSAFLFYSTAVTYVDNNQINPIAVSSVSRLPLLTSVPTFAEVGISSVGVIDPWFAIFSNDTQQTKNLDQIKQALLALMNDPEFRQKLQELGLIPPKSFQLPSTFLLLEQKKYQNLIYKYNLEQ
jgi:tripartite-type tricarboxylate transporter receptor subunit TctC